MIGPRHAAAARRRRHRRHHALPLRPPVAGRQTDESLLLGVTSAARRCLRASSRSDGRVVAQERTPRHRDGPGSCHQHHRRAHRHAACVRRKGRRFAGGHRRGRAGPVNTVTGRIGSTRASRPRARVASRWRRCCRSLRLPSFPPPSTTTATRSRSANGCSRRAWPPVHGAPRLVMALARHRARRPPAPRAAGIRRRARPHPVNFDGPPCWCGRTRVPGPLRERAGDHGRPRAPARAPPWWPWRAGDPPGITPPLVFRAASSGELVARPSSRSGAGAGRDGGHVVNAPQSRVIVITGGVCVLRAPGVAHSLAATLSTRSRTGVPPPRGHRAGGQVRHHAGRGRARGVTRPREEGWTPAELGRLCKRRAGTFPQKHPVAGTHGCRRHCDWFASVLHARIPATFCGSRRRSREGHHVPRCE